MADRRPKFGTYRQLTRQPEEPHFSAAYDQGLEAADDAARELDVLWEKILRVRAARNRTFRVIFPANVMASLEKLHEVLEATDSAYQRMARRSPVVVLKMAVERGLKIISNYGTADRVDILAGTAWPGAQRSINRAHARLRRERRAGQ